MSFEFDEIGIWSELKLEIIEKYGAAYTRAFTNQPFLKIICHRPSMWNALLSAQVSLA